MVFMFVVLPMGVYAVEGISSVSDKAENRWSIFGGYGITHSGLGKTRVQVQSVDFIPRYEHVLTETMGSSWYQGRHSLMLETPLTLVVDPDVDRLAIVDNNGRLANLLDVVQATCNGLIRTLLTYDQLNQRHLVYR